MSKRAENWIFGYNAWVNFSTGSPVSQPIGGNQMVTNEGCDSVSDAISGALLFYTDGESLWDSGNTLITSDITDGAGLDPNLSIQAITVVQVPLSSDDYLMFMVGNWNTGGTLYPIIYRAYNSTTKVLGSAVTLATQGGSYGYAENLTAALHANNRDIWIITHQRGSNQFKSWKILPNKVNHSAITSTSSWSYTGQNRFGQIKISPNGKKLVLASGKASFGDGNPVVLSTYNFNNATGVINGEEILLTENFSSTIWDIIGVDFSRNSSVLYASSLVNRNFWKFDLKLSPVQYVRKLSPNTGSLGAVQRGPDDRIYIVQNGKSFIYKIDTPDDPTLTISETTHTLTIGTQGRLGLPLAPQILDYIPRDYRVYSGGVWYSVCGADVIRFYDAGSASWKTLQEGDLYYNKTLRDFETIECTIPTPPPVIENYPIEGYYRPEDNGYGAYNSSTYVLAKTDLTAPITSGNSYTVTNSAEYEGTWFAPIATNNGPYKDVILETPYISNEPETEFEIIIVP